MTLQDIQDLVRRGRIGSAQRELNLLKTRNLARDERLKAAQVAREADFPGKVIEILHPVIRPSGRGKPFIASPEEKSEYAIALVYLGLTGEARALLKNTAVSGQPRVAQAEAFSYFRDGDFKTALQITSEALRSKSKLRDNERYEQLIDYGLSLLHGRANRYRQPDHDECRKVFSNLLAEIDGKGFNVVRIFALFGIAISHLYERNWAECDRGLDVAEALLQNSGFNLSSSILLMWRCLAGLGRAIDRGEKTAPFRWSLATLRERYIKSGRAGYARACDYDAAILLGDTRTLERMYFDVSQDCYRAHIEAQLEAFGARVPDYHDRAMGARKAKPVRAVDLLDVEQLKCYGLKQGQLPHRILTALASDIYDRPNLVHLFGLAFPNEFFHPDSSPAKVEQGLFRLRQALKACRAPLVIWQENGLFRLETASAVTLRFYRTGELAAFQSRVRAAFGDRGFSSTAFAKAFKLPERTSKHRLRQACVNGWLVRSRHGRATRYRLR